MIGTVRNVTTFHAAPMRLPMIRPRKPKRSSIAWMITETVAESTAHGRMRCRRDCATPSAWLEVRVAALSRSFAPAHSAARKYVWTSATPMYVQKPSTYVTTLAEYSVSPLIPVSLPSVAHTASAKTPTTIAEKMNDSTGSQSSPFSDFRTAQLGFRQGPGALHASHARIIDHRSVRLDVASSSGRSALRTSCPLQAVLLLESRR